MRKNINEMDVLCKFHTRSFNPEAPRRFGENMLHVGFIEREDEAKLLLTVEGYFNDNNQRIDIEMELSQEQAKLLMAKLSQSVYYNSLPRS